MRKVRVATSVAIGALATGDLGTGVLTLAASDTYRLVTTKLAYSWTDVQAVIDDTMEFGLAHSDYSAAEIEECIEAGASIDLGNKVQQEQANRLVRTIGVFNQGTHDVGAGASFNDGLPVKVKLNWKMSIGDTLNVWFRNGSGVVYTTGSSISAIGDIWIVQ